MATPAKTQPKGPREIDVRYAVGLALAFLAVGIYVGTKLAGPPLPFEIAIPKVDCEECAKRSLAQHDSEEIPPVEVTEDAPDPATD